MESINPSETNYIAAAPYYFQTEIEGNNLGELSNLAKALVEVIKACASGIDKSMTVGAGMNSYKAIADKDVKAFVGSKMAENGLCLLPLEIDPTLDVTRYEEVYNGNAKQKKEVFTAIRAKYLLLHTSGERLVVQSYGHGIDTQDKSAGKAMTYSMKYCLLYLGLVPTGLIDDTDNRHSDDTPMKPDPKAVKKTPAPAKEAKPVAAISEEGYQKAITGNGDKDLIEKILSAVSSGSRTATKEQVEALNAKLEFFNTPTPSPEAESPEEKPQEAEWITEEQLKTALTSGVKGIEATLKAIFNNKLKASDEDVEKLNGVLTTLKKRKENGAK